MAKEYPASKTQMSKAAELGIDTSDAPSYTTLGGRLETAGWTKDGKRPMDDSDVPLASLALDSLASRKTPYEMRQERKVAKRAGALGAVRDEDEDDEGRPLYRPVTTGSHHGDPTEL